MRDGLRSEAIRHARDAAAPRKHLWPAYPALAYSMLAPSARSLKFGFRLVTTAAELGQRALDKLGRAARVGRMSKSDTRKVLTQASHYGIASLFTQVLGGLITFPLLTRVLSVEQYGTLSFIGATLSLAVAFGKTGVQHSVVRLHAPVAAGKSEFNLQQLYSTTLFGMGGSAVVAGILLIGFAILAPQSLIERRGFGYRWPWCRSWW